MRGVLDEPVALVDSAETRKFDAPGRPAHRRRPPAMTAESPTVPSRRIADSSSVGSFVTTLKSPAVVFLPEERALRAAEHLDPLEVEERAQK